MIPKTTLDAVQSLDIVTVISQFVSLTKKGANYLACCPLHGEKTPSFSVSSAKGIFKCFGCGAAGDAIGFVMKLEKIDFKDAVLRIAKDHNIAIPEENHSEEELERYKKHEGIRIANQLVSEWFENNMQQTQNSKSLEYVKSRWNDETIAQFRIGFAPDGWDNLKKWAKSKGIREEILIESGLLQESKERVFDFFRNRIMFPILDTRGRVSGFTGRDFSGDNKAQKYLNTRETEVYKKGEILYGLNFARQTAREKGFMYLVEGNADVIRMHQIGKLNTVGTCGTSLTESQIESIMLICPSVTIIGDSDKSGKKAVERSAELLISSGLFVNIIELPVKCRISDFLVENEIGKEKDIKEVKCDPDSFFVDSDQFDMYAKATVKDFIFWKVDFNLDKVKHPDFKSKLIDSISKMIIKLPESSHEVYVDQLSKMVKPKKAWQDSIKAVKEVNAPVKEHGFKIPDHILLSDVQKYGFYQDNNCYWFETVKGLKRGTNFVMEPLFHISSVLNAKRIYKITNEFGYSQVIELLQKDLIGLSAFRLRIESLGNFLFEASEVELNKLKRYLYEKTDTCFEVTQLGWQKQGFWAWCNGIYNGEFQSTDDNGIVMFSGTKFYLPASSKVYASEDSFFIGERRFKHIRESKVSLNEYTGKLMKVFGDNAMFGVCFYMACLFRDHIVKQFGFFPILNLFGPKGAGKTELAISLMQFFGNQSKGPNLTNTTKAALADHVAMFSNTCCHIDEYKNNIEYEKIEFLKGLWDGTGRTRMNMDKDRKKETTHVDTGIILSGQEMPTADIVLFSRLIFLSFTKVEYTDYEKSIFNELKEMEKTGLTNITHHLLSYRAEFIENFIENYNASAKVITDMLAGGVIEDRIFRNWLVILAAYRTLKEKVKLPFAEDELFHTAVSLIVRQNSETKKSNELSIFWSIVEFLANNGKIREDVDFKIDYVTRLKTDRIESEWPTPKTVIYINHSQIFQLYLTHGNQSKQSILPIKTIEYYLCNCKEYLGRKNSVAFKVVDNGQVVEDGMDSEGIPITKRKITTAMVFDYNPLNINMATETTKSKVTNYLP